MMNLDLIAEDGIRSCPFCGNPIVKIEQHQTAQMEDILFTAVVRCDKCGAIGPTASRKVNVHDSKWDVREYAKQKAIELWNDRV
jgi:Lar family restriction alleviation protein